MKEELIPVLFVEKPGLFVVCTLLSFTHLFAVSRTGSETGQRGE